VSKPTGIATHNGRVWVDGSRKPIIGAAPLAQLGVGGQYVDPQDGRTKTITKIDASQVDAKGRPFTIVVATAQGTMSAAAPLATEPRVPAAAAAPAPMPAAAPAQMTKTSFWQVLGIKPRAK